MRQNFPRTKVFISYRHADRRFLDRLHVFLKPLERQGFIDWWDDTRIDPGDDWRKAIKDALDTAQVALLMLSPDFLASDFIDQDELPPLVEAAAKDHAVILQVVLGPINFGTWKLNNFQAINNPARPLGKLRTRADRDEVWRDVSNRIVEALKSGQTASMMAERVAIDKTAETIAHIQLESPTSPVLPEENRQPQSPSSSGGLPSDTGDVLTKDRTPSVMESPPPTPLVEAEFQAATKAPHQHPALSWIQIAWWRLIELWDEFKSCRLSLLALLATCFFFLFVSQGIEVLRALSEGSASGRVNDLLQVPSFFVALILLGVCNWYTARVLFYFDFSGVRRRLPATASWDNLIDTLQTLLPRLLGVAPFLVVGVGFVLASRSYNRLTPDARWLLGFAGVCGLLAFIFYFVLVLRRRLIGNMPTRELESFRELDRGRMLEICTIGGIITLVSLLLFVTFTLSPIVAAQNLGPGAIVLFAMSSWVTFGSVFVYAGSRLQIPIISYVVFCALLFSFWNDNHLTRFVPRQEVKRADLIGSFQTWYNLVEKDYGTGTMHPLYIVATEGGMIRAAYWTAVVLGVLQDRNPNFASHLFAISCVSGGSLGAVVFEALLAEPDRGSFQENAHKILGQDFLSPALASMFYPDLVQRFIPFPIPYFDRGRSTEPGWERAWRNKIGNDRFAGSFVDLWKPGSREWMPALFLNGTSVEKGNRIITSNLRLTNNFLDADDAAQKLASHTLGATEAACHVPLSTAVQMSSRDGLLIPAGRFPDGSHILDGAYFENSGTTAAWEIATRIKEWCAFKKIANVEVKVIMIADNPRKPPIAPAAPVEPSGPKLTSPTLVKGQFMSELSAPLYTLLNTRDARSTYMEKVITHEQRRFKTGFVQAPDDAESSQPLSKDIIYFKLRDTQVPLPLGWMLSAKAAMTIREQINLDDDVVQNYSAMNEVLKTLPPPR